MSEEKLTRIESLKRRMYSRNTEGMRGTREHPLHTPISQVKNDWEYSEVPNTNNQKVRRSGVTYFLIGSVAFFGLASLFAVFSYWGGGNVVSADNVSIEIAGPVSVRAGEVLSLDISVENNNATPLEAADLLVEYPDGTRDAEDQTKELPRFRESLGDISAGDSVKKNVLASLFGEERVLKDIKITVEYRVPGSNAIFYKEASYQVLISSAPLSLLVEAPDEATSGQEITLKAIVESNSSEIIKNVLLAAEYPSGFSFTGSTPTPTFESKLWRLGDIEPGGKRTFQIRGALLGENSDSKVFRFNIGTESPKDETVIGTPFTSALETITIKKPFVALSVLVNGSREDTVPVKSGRPIRVDITYTNNLLVPVSDVIIEMQLLGTALDKRSVSTEDGFYRSQDDTVVWDKTSSSDLGLVPPGESGTVSVSLNSRSIAGGITSLRNPEIRLIGSVEGRRVESGRVPEEVVATVKKLVHVETDVTFTNRLLYYSGPFQNTGPIPPKAENETTYTVLWSLTNGSNDLGETVVTAPLPSYVKFIAATHGENVTYSTLGGVVTWNVGSVKAGTGYNTPPREASFRIAITPSISQIGEKPILMGDLLFKARDRFTNTLISFERGDLDTRLSTDPQAKSRDEIVVQ